MGYEFPSPSVYLTNLLNTNINFINTNKYFSFMKVKIYTTISCVFCKKAKEFFKEHNIDYKEIDVGKDAKAARDMIEKSGQMGVPVIEIDGEIIIGFDKPALIKALKINA